MKCKKRPTSHNKRLAQKCLFGIFGFRKTPFGLSPSAVFCSTTFLLLLKLLRNFFYRNSKNVANLNTLCNIFVRVFLDADK